MLGNIRVEIIIYWYSKKCTCFYLFCFGFLCRFFKNINLDHIIFILLNLLRLSTTLFFILNWGFLLDSALCWLRGLLFLGAAHKNYFKISLFILKFDNPLMWIQYFIWFLTMINSLSALELKVAVLNFCAIFVRSRRIDMCRSEQ